GFSTAAINHDPSTPCDRSAEGRRIKIPQISPNWPGETLYPAPPRCVISSKCDGPRPAECRMGDRLTVGQRTLAPHVWARLLVPQPAVSLPSARHCTVA